MTRVKVYSPTPLLKQAKEALMRADYEDALSLYEEALGQANRARDKALAVAASNGILRTELSGGVASKEEIYIQDVLEMARSISNRELTGLSLVNLGTILSAQILHVESESFKENVQDRTERTFSEAIDIFERMSKDANAKVSRLAKEGLADAFIRYALMNIELDDQVKALDCLQKAKALAKELDDPYLKAQAYQGLGFANFNKGDLDGSLKFYKLSRKYWRELGNRDMTSVVDAGMGEAYLAHHLAQDALSRFQAAFDSYKKMGVRTGWATMLSRMGLAYIEIKEYKQARKCFEQAVGAFKKMSNRRMGVFCKIGALDTEFLLGNKRFAKKMLLQVLYSDPVKQYYECYNYLYNIVTREKWLRDEKEFKVMFEAPQPITIEKALMEEIIQYAKEAYPNEFGAMLHGNPHIDDLEFPPDIGRGHASVSFSMYNRFSQRNIQADGVVHSHPSGSARPSQADITMFGHFPGTNIIIGYPFAWDSWAAYDRFGNRITVDIIVSKAKPKKEVDLS